jgi:enediyne biosynthesis protein E4
VTWIRWSAPLLLALVPWSSAGQPAQTPSAVRLTFADVTVASKIGFVHQSGASPEKYMVETFGSGLGWIDYDNDGFQDLYFVNGAPGTSNVLYRNNHDGTFTD